MEKKYELTNEVINTGTTLHRIRAVRDFTLSDGTQVKMGDLGGFVESEANLSHAGNCWVADYAWAIGHSYVECDGLVRGYARITDHARVSAGMVIGNAILSGNAALVGGIIGGYTTVRGGHFSDGAAIFSGLDYMAVDGLLSNKYASLTFFRCQDGLIRVHYDIGRTTTLDEFREIVGGDGIYLHDSLIHEGGDMYLALIGTAEKYFNLQCQKDREGIWRSNLRYASRR